jgi:signal transduction histidine kinase/ActR/RegA family two-component response regulator
MRAVTDCHALRRPSSLCAPRAAAARRGVGEGFARQNFHDFYGILAVLVQSGRMSLSSTPAAPAAADNRRVLQRIVVAGLVVALIVLAGTLGLVTYAAEAIDHTQAKREEALISHLLKRTLIHMRHNVDSSAVWDRAYETMTPKVTPGWADPNFGSYYADFMEQPVTVIFDSAGSYVYASRDSEDVPLAREQPLADAVAPLVASVRQESARRRFGPGGVRNVGFKAVVTRETILAVKGDLYLIAVSTIVPEHLSAARHFSGPDPVVVSGKPMGLFLKSLTDDLSIQSPRVVRAGDPSAGPRVALKGPDGQVLGEIRWTPERPGLGLLGRAQPVIWTVVALLILAAFVLLSRVMVTLRRLDENERHLTAARDAADAANAAKSQFLANMSHELRTPLNGIVAVADVLKKRLTDRSDLEMIDLIAASSGVLEQVVNDILDAARIESGRIALEAAAFDLEDCVRGVAKLHGEAARARNLRLDWRIAPAARGAYIGDPTRVTQILSNLLSNAVKFTAEGSVRLTVHKCPAGLRIAVRDSGMGFDEETRRRLFRRFEQADVSMTRRHGGTGLGLSICASLVEAMGGSIAVRSVLGKGTIFVVTLPLKRAAQTESLTAPASDPEATESRPFRVLLAEDHPTNQRVIALILEPLGVDLTVVEDGAQAVEATARDPYDLILMDVQMPVMDGLAATRAIRAAEAADGRPRTPVVSLTAHAMAEHVAASLASGADRHLAKPVRPDVLIQTLIDLTADDESQEERAEQAA